jgi:DNA excision repair protein ERCC-2
MPARFDEATKTFEISVRELAETDGFRPIGSDRGGGWIQWGTGAELHSRILQDRCRQNPLYQREVHLQLRVALDDWTAIVTGRLDGVFPSDDGWQVEEFKSACLVDGRVRQSNSALERHRRQLLIYCLLWHRLGHAEVSGSLVYVDVATSAESVLPTRFDPQEHGRAVDDRLRALLAQWLEGAESRRRKVAAAAGLPFPHGSPRPAQQQLMEAVATALEQREHLIAEAPTGSGKTLAGIFPALAHGLARGRQVLFLTAKSLQQTMAVRAFTALNEGAFRTLQMRSKEKMCANGEVLCHDDFCSYARNYPEKMERTRILDRLQETHRHYDPETVFSAAREMEVCPFEVQLELASRADALTLDYNYVFEPGTALQHLEDLRDVILIVDEAHNLPDRIRQIFSPALDDALLAAAVSALEQITDSTEPARGGKSNGKNRRDPQSWFELEGSGQGSGFAGAARSTLSALRALLRETAEKFLEERMVAEMEPPRRELLALWREWEPSFGAYVSWKHERKIVRPDDPVVQAHFEWQRFSSVLNTFFREDALGGFTALIDRRGGGPRLALLCLDSALPLTAAFREAHSVIFLSATLRPIRQMERLLGVEPARTATLSLPPAFPRENRRILILPGVKTTFGAREKYYPQIARSIASMADAVPGNVLVLFPSYAFLCRVAGLLPPMGSRLVQQRPDLSERERAAIFTELAATGDQPILLFAVMGGMYAEGVDYPGELLSGVFVVSPALPQVSFERELLRHYFDGREQAGFEYAYLLPGMTRVIQAAGRLIRSETDRGVIALICQRFLLEPYASLLPRDWYVNSPDELVADDPAGAIRAFFAGISLSKQAGPLPVVGGC